MKRLIIYHIGTRWFAYAVVSEGDSKEFRSVEIPQVKAEIEAFAKREGFEIEWDEPAPDTSTGRR